MPDSFTKLGKEGLAEQERIAAEVARQPNIEEVARRRAEERTQAEMMRAGFRGPAEDRVEREGGMVRGRYRPQQRGPWQVTSRPGQEERAAQRQVQRTMQPGMTPEDARSMDLAATPQEAMQQVEQRPSGAGLNLSDLDEDQPLSDAVRRAMLLDPQLRQRLQGQAFSDALLQLQSGRGDPRYEFAGIPRSELSTADYAELARGEDEPRRPPNNVYTHIVNSDALGYLPSVTDSPDTVGITQEEVPAHELGEGVERGNAYGTDVSDVRTYLQTAHPEGILQGNRIREAMGLPGGRTIGEDTIALPNGEIDQVTRYTHGETHVITKPWHDGRRVVRQYTVPYARPSGGR